MKPGMNFLLRAAVTTVAVFVTGLSVCQAKDREGGWYAEMTGLGSTGRGLPFWSHTNKGGIYPETVGGLVRGGADGSGTFSNGIRFSWGVGLAGYAAARGSAQVHNSDGKSVRGMVQNLYFGAGWKKLALEVGIKERESRISKASPSREAT